MNDFILGPQTPLTTSWFDTTQVNMARKLGRLCPAIPPTDPAQLNSYNVNLQYYDLPKSEYIVSQRTGSTEFRDYGRNAADSWYQHPQWIKSGAQRDFFNGQSAPPRHGGIGGLILRALDGKPEYWDFIVAYTQAHLNIWLLWRLPTATNPNPPLHVDVREGAFAFHYAVWLSQTLPDSYPLQTGGTATNGASIRAQLLVDLGKITTDYYQRLQSSCGCWRYDANMRDDPKPDNPTGDGGMIIGITQPFTIGLLLLAFADFHQITTDTVVKTSLASMILKACRHLYFDGPYRKTDPTPFDPNKRWRCFWYLFHGGTTVNPTKFEQGGWSLPGVNANEVSDARQSIGPVVAAYAYAHKITGDPILLEAFNELWDAAYNGSDGIRNLMDTDGKGFNQNCARAGSGPAWLGVAAPIPAPSPIPTPTPSPTPVPTPQPLRTPSPDNTKGPSIVDAQGALWTLGQELQTLKDATHVGRGAGVEYKYSVGAVYVRGGTDNKIWYKWAAPDWLEHGTTEPGGSVTPTPTPIPVPPTPTPTLVLEKIAWSTTKSGQDKVMAAQRARGFYPYKNATGTFMTFEKK